MKNIDVRILNYLKLKNKSVTKDEIVHSLGLNSFFVDEILSKLEKEGKIKKTSSKYQAIIYCDAILNVGKKGAYIDYMGEKIWVNKNRLNGATNGDFVSVKILDENTGEIVNILDKHLKNNAGVVISREGKFYIKPDKEKIYIDAPNLILGSKVIYEKCNLIKNNIYSGNVIKVIGHVDDPKADVIERLKEYDVSIKFNDKVMNELKTIDYAINNSDLVGRVDLRDKEIFTIDGDDTKDLDDAVSLEKMANGNYKLGVHIADVSHYIRYNSELDKEAYARSTSIYPVGSVIPMIPHYLSSGICSLFEGVDRLTMTCDMIYDSKGNLLEYKIYPSVINSKKKMTYSKVNDVISGKEVYGYDIFKDKLLLMDEFKNILKNKRMKHGSIEFAVDKVKIVLDDVGRPIEIVKDKRADAEKLIEEFMLAANTCVAKDLSIYDSSVFRIHEEPDPDRLMRAVSRLKKLGVDVPEQVTLANSSVKELLGSVEKTEYASLGSEMVLRSMARAEYAKENCGHYGLAFEKYTHFTSPIRRYPDLTVHRLIKMYHGFEDREFNLPNDIADYLIGVGIHTSMQERNADTLEGYITRVKMAEYMEQYMDEVFEGRIIDILRDSLNIQLYNGVIGKLVFNCNTKATDVSLKTKYKLYKLGDTVTVSVDYINKMNGDIRFEEKTKKLKD